MTINEGRETTEVRVGNAGDRPVQVGSHFHFFEANAALSFDREAAFGMRLNVPAGTAVRFEPGDEKTIELVALGGKRVAHGMNGLVNGSVDERTACLVACQEFVTNLVGAAQRLASLGHTDAQRVVVDCQPAMVDAVDASADRSLDEMTPFAPLIDVRAAEHERADRRLFLS